MSNAQIDYYAILKVSQYATPEEVKKSYRELARRYHPDVNHSADAAQQIKAINEAYHVLGDADRRATYDAQRILDAEANRAAARRESQKPASSPSSGASASSHPQGAPYDYNGFGRVRAESYRTRADRARPGAGPRPGAQTASSASAQGTPRRPARESQANIGQTLQSLIADAQMAYVMRRYSEAERLCRQVLTLDRRQPVVHEMLGDIYARRGDSERATTAYAYAIQFNPRNQSAQMKLERLSGAEVSHRGPTMTRRSQTPFLERMLDGPNRYRFIGAASLALIALLAGAFSFVAFYPGYDSAFVVGALSLNLMICLAIAGLAAGTLLAFYGGMRPASQELALRTDARSPVRLSTLLSFSALIWLYASLLIYIFVAVSRNRPSFSVMRAYGVSILLSVGFACLYHSVKAPLSGVETAAFGGNLLFPTILMGWRLGDRLRLGGM